MVSVQALNTQILLGFTFVACWAAQESRAVYKAKVFRRARCLSATISCWRRTTSQFGAQHDLGHSASRHFRRQALTAGLSFWRRRVAHVTHVNAIITRFQVPPSTAVPDRADRCLFNPVLFCIAVIEAGVCYNASTPKVIETTSERVVDVIA